MSVDVRLWAGAFGNCAREGAETTDKVTRKAPQPHHVRAMNEQVAGGGAVSWWKMLSRRISCDIYELQLYTHAI
jgi:hypothetical protein